MYNIIEHRRRLGYHCIGMDSKAKYVEVLAQELVTLMERKPHDVMKMLNNFHTTPLLVQLGELVQFEEHRRLSSFPLQELISITPDKWKNPIPSIDAEVSFLSVRILKLIMLELFVITGHFKAENMFPATGYAADVLGDSKNMDRDSIYTGSELLSKLFISKIFDHLMDIPKAWAMDTRTSWAERATAPGMAAKNHTVDPTMRMIGFDTQSVMTFVGKMSLLIQDFRIHRNSWNNIIAFQLAEDSLRHKTRWEAAVSTAITHNVNFILDVENYRRKMMQQKKVKFDETNGYALSVIAHREAARASLSDLKKLNLDLDHSLEMGQDVNDVIAFLNTKSEILHTVSLDDYAKRYDILASGSRRGNIRTIRKGRGTPFTQWLSRDDSFDQNIMRYERGDLPEEHPSRSAEKLWLPADPYVPQFVTASDEDLSTLFVARTIPNIVQWNECDIYETVYKSKQRTRVEPSVTATRLTQVSSMLRSLYPSPEIAPFVSYSIDNQDAILSTPICRRETTVGTNCLLVDKREMMLLAMSFVGFDVDYGLYPLVTDETMVRESGFVTYDTELWQNKRTTCPEYVLAIVPKWRRGTDSFFNADNLRPIPRDRRADVSGLPTMSTLEPVFGSLNGQKTAILDAKTFYGLSLEQVYVYNLIDPMFMLRSYVMRKFAWLMEDEFGSNGTRQAMEIRIENLYQEFLTDEATKSHLIDQLPPNMYYESPSRRLDMVKLVVKLVGIIASDHIMPITYQIKPSERLLARSNFGDSIHG